MILFATVCAEELQDLQRKFCQESFQVRDLESPWCLGYDEVLSRTVWHPVFNSWDTHDLPAQKREPGLNSLPQKKRASVNVILLSSFNDAKQLDWTFFCRVDNWELLEQYSESTDLSRVWSSHGLLWSQSSNHHTVKKPLSSCMHPHESSREVLDIVRSLIDSLHSMPAVGSF